MHLVDSESSNCGDSSQALDCERSALPLPATIPRSSLSPSSPLASDYTNASPENTPERFCLFSDVLVMRREENRKATAHDNERHEY